MILQKAEILAWPGVKNCCRVMAVSVIIGTGMNKLAKRTEVWLVTELMLLIGSESKAS